MASRRLLLAYLKGTPQMGLMYAFDWTNQIGIGSVITWLVLVATLVVSVLTIRSKLYTDERDRRLQVEDELRLERDKSQAQLAADAELRHELKSELAAERMKTELTPILEGITTGFSLMKEDSDRRTETAIENIIVTIRQEFQKHEDRAAERHEASIEVLQEMATSLREAA